MAITGLYTDLPIVGPFRSSGGDYYIFGRDVSTATTLQAYKATDPDGTWSSIDTQTGYSTGILNYRAKKIADVVHLIIADGIAGSINYKYLTFNMASDAFVTAETIASALDTRNAALSSLSECSIQVRSGGEVVAAFHGQRKKYGGTWQSHLYYSRRTGINTWTSPGEISNTSGDQGQLATAIDASDNVYLQFYGAGKILDASNSVVAGLDLYTTPAQEGFAYTNSDNNTQVAFVSTGGDGYWSTFVPGDVSVVLTSIGGAGFAGSLIRGYIDTDAPTPTAWVIYKDDSNKIVTKSSTDNGSTWSAPVTVTADATDYSSLSLDSPLYSTTDDVFASVIYVDNAAATGHKGHVVRTKRINVNLSSTVAAGAVAAVSKSVAKPGEAALATAATDLGVPAASVGIVGRSANVQQNSLTAEGADVSVSLQSVSFAPGVATFGMATETMGGTVSLSLTRLGPGGYPIAALPGAPAGPLTSVNIFSADAAGAYGSFVGFEFAIGLTASVSSASIAAPVWTVFHSLGSVNVSANVAGTGPAVSLPGIASISAPAGFEAIAPSLRSRIGSITGLATVDEFAVSGSFALDAVTATTSVAEFSPYIFTGTSVVLNSIASQAIASDVIVQDQIVLPEAISAAAANILRMEGDEAFNLAAAAATGSVGDLLVAIVIPAAIKWLVCASIDITPEVAGDVAMNEELQATLIAAAALQGSPAIGAEVNGALEIAPIVVGTPSMKEC